VTFKLALKPRQIPQAQYFVELGDIPVQIRYFLELQRGTPILLGHQLRIALM
jgi:hypothetical protein